MENDMRKTKIFSDKEVDAISKLYLSAAIGFEHLSLQDEEVHETLKSLFQKMGFESNDDCYAFRDLVFHNDKVDEMIKMAKDLTYKEKGNLLFSVIEMRYGSDPMGGQFNRHFDLFLIYLVNSIFGFNSENSIINEIMRKNFAN